MKLGRKIMVIGCPGSGKSTLSRELRDITGLPLFHLDNIWWKPDRSHISREEVWECMQGRAVYLYRREARRR